MKPRFIGIKSTGTQHIHIKEKNEPFLSSPLHFHELCELVYIEESFGKRIVGDSVQNFQKNDLVFMGPNIPHIWYNDQDFQKNELGLRAKAIVIYFDADFLLNLIDDKIHSTSIQKLLVKAQRGLSYNGKAKEQVIKKMKEIKSLGGLRQYSHFLMIMDILVQTDESDYLSSSGSSFYLNKDDTRRINDIYLYLFKNFTHDIFLDDVAKVACMTPNSFCRFFKSRTQKSFTTFLNELRVGHACKLLLDQSLSINQICYDSGFNNLTNFNKFFKLIKNTTPSEYRKHIIL